MSYAARLVTAAELERFPDDDFRYELVAGRVIRMSPVGYRHGSTVVQVIAVLNQHVRGNRLGVVLTEVGFTLTSNPDTVRAPDVAFIRQERIPTPAPVGFWTGGPDLALEVVSPDDHASDIRAKVKDYLRAGVKAVAILDPDSASATVYRPFGAPQAVRADDQLDFDDVLPGFRCTVRELFA